MVRGQGEADSIIALNRVTGRKPALEVQKMFLLEGETMATSETSHLVETVTGEAAQLRELLSGLDAKTWASDSTCEGWTIEDVVAHLAGSASGWAHLLFSQRSRKHSMNQSLPPLM